MKLESKKQVQNRLRRIEGQVRGLQALVERDTYCIDIITQTSAIKSALSGVEDLLLESHLDTCASAQIKSGDIGKAKQEILAVYRLKRK
jgi:CsoR family transcriptional regulator, copper-sensing transcriptional repressor